MQCGFCRSFVMLLHEEYAAQSTNPSASAQVLTQSPITSLLYYQVTKCSFGHSVMRPFCCQHVVHVKFCQHVVPAVFCQRCHACTAASLLEHHSYYAYAGLHTDITPYLVLYFDSPVSCQSLLGSEWYSCIMGSCVLL